MVTYGIISDISDSSSVKDALRVLQRLGAERLILNGGVSILTNNSDINQSFIAEILDTVGKTGLETYVQPGAFATVQSYIPVINHFQKKHPNLFHPIYDRVIDCGDHHLLFIPGSDVDDAGDFIFGSNEFARTGFYIKTDDGLVWQDSNQEKRARELGKFRGHLHYSNLNDFVNLSEPEKTVAFCNVPRRFNSPINGVDGIYYGRKHDGQIVSGEIVEQLIKKSYDELSIQEFAVLNEKLGMTLHRENKGNTDLEQFFTKNGITKAISAHFPDAAHRAHDSSSQPIKSGELVDNLFWNTGQLATGKAGLLEVKENRVAYRNVVVNEHLLRNN